MKEMFKFLLLTQVDAVLHITFCMMSVVGSLGIFFRVISGTWPCMVCWMTLVKISSCLSSKDRGMQKASFHLCLNNVPLVYVTHYVFILHTTT
jgi:hypothetical protein